MFVLGGFYCGSADLCLSSVVSILQCGVCPSGVDPAGVPDVCPSVVSILQGGLTDVCPSLLSHPAGVLTDVCPSVSLSCSSCLSLCLPAGS